MKNAKLRNYLFETIWEKNTLEWIILWNYYNNGNNVKLPLELVIKAQERLLEWIMDIEWIRWDDVIHNAWN